MNKQLLLIALLCVGLLPMQAGRKARLKATKPMPILAWYANPDSASTPERYKELREAGFTISFPHLYSLPHLRRALRAAKAADMQVLAMCNEMWDKTEEVIGELKRSKQVAAYFLRDEPVCAQMPELGKMVRRIQALDPKRSCYINLLPDCGAEALGAPYPEYVERGITELGCKILSWDIYPVTTGGVNPSWYFQLETISAAARRHNMPFWAFALLTPHGGYPLPTLASLRLQHYANLCYGAQCLQYFTYWNPTTETWNFYQAPINLQGKRSVTYDLVRQMNRELQAVAPVFVGCTVRAVNHIGSQPYGTTDLATLPEGFKAIDSHGAHALVSQIENNGRRFLVIQNANLDRAMTLTVVPPVGAQFVQKDGTLEAAALYDPTTTVEPGDVRIYCY